MPDLTITRLGPLELTARAIRARLELVFPPRVFTHSWMPARVDKDVWERLIQRLPLVAIGFNRFHRPETFSALTVQSEWSVYVATRNPRSEEALLFGDDFAPGSLSLIQVSAAILHGCTLPGLGSIQVSSATAAFIEDRADPSLGIGAIELTVKTDLSLPNLLTGDGITPVNLTTQTIQWTFGADPGVDLTDTITNTGTS
jgi:hypothetical protein